MALFLRLLLALAASLALPAWASSLPAPLSSAAPETASGVSAASVDEEHTYFVGDLGAWVHNTCDLISPYKLRRTHNLEGRAASKNVDNIKSSMGQNGFDPNSPVDVFRIGDELYVLDGHHRVAAAKSAGIDVFYREVAEADLGKFGYGSADDVFNAWVNVAPDRLR